MLLGKIKNKSSNFYRRDPHTIKIFFIKLKKATPILLGFVLIGFLIWGIGFLKNPKTFPIRQVKIVTDRHHVEKSTLQQTIDSNLSGGFFSLRSYELRKALLALPWIADVALRKVWPDQLIVKIIEQKPVARWGKYQLINSQGVLFQPKADTLPTDLPLLKGPEYSTKKILKKYQEIKNALSLIGVSVLEVELSERGAWRIVLNHHITVMLGRDDIEQRFQRLVTLYPRIVRGHEDQIDRIDLRYPNGLSIHWKK